MFKTPRFKICAFVFGLFSSTLGSYPVQAQVVGDRTLPSPSQVTSPADNIFEITGGTQTGRNLFHSFRQFSIPNNGRASFQSIAPTIDRVISRVTGPSKSRINGILEILQPGGAVSNADFFLINPNGIVFGPSAELNLGGSFLGTTAESMIFEDGAAFHTNNPQPSDLLTISSPIGLQFGNVPQPIRYRIPRMQIEGIDVPLPVNALPILPDHTFALIGGGLFLTGLNEPNEPDLQEPNVNSGRIELGSFGASTLVPLAITPNKIQIDLRGIETLGHIQLRNVRLDSGIGLGAIKLFGDQVEINNGSFLQTESLSDNQNGADITIEASELSITNSGIVTINSGSGRGGNIELMAQSINIDNSSGIGTRNIGPGRGGNINLVAGNISINTGSQLVTEVAEGATGQGGHIFMSAQSIDIRGLFIFEDANRGLRAQPSALRALVLGSEGQGGNIWVESEELSLRGGTQIFTNTSGMESAGNIRIDTTTLILDGVACCNRDGEPFISESGRTFPSTLSTLAEETADEKAQGGNIDVITEHLSVLNGATIQTSTFGAGNAGNLTIDATKSVVLDGVVLNIPGGLYSFSGGIPQLPLLEEGIIGNPNATGNGGELTVETGDLIIRNNAVISVSSLNDDGGTDTTGNTRQAGTLNIEADTINLLNQGNILSTSASVNGGDINIESDRFLFLRQGSLISSEAGSDIAGGNGGNIDINSPFIVSIETEDSDIQADAARGDGGGIILETQGIYGIEIREQETDFSDITSFSRAGVNGPIINRNPDTDPSRSLAELPGALLSREDRIDNNVCRAATTNNSSFTSVGQGGVLPSPRETFRSEEIWEDWRLPPLSEQSSHQQLTALPSINESTQDDRQAIATMDLHSSPPIEAQGWYRTATGGIMLVTDDSMTTPPETLVHVMPATQASSCNNPPLVQLYNWRRTAAKQAL